MSSVLFQYQHVSSTDIVAQFLWKSSLCDYGKVRWQFFVRPFKRVSDLPEVERVKAIELFDLTVEQLSASEERKAEIDALGCKLIAELDQLSSEWESAPMNIYAPVGSKLREEWEDCMEGWKEVYESDRSST